MERGQPDLIFLHGVLTQKNWSQRLSQRQRILLTTERREVQFVKARNTIATGMVAIDRWAWNDGCVPVGGAHVDNRGGWWGLRSMPSAA